MTLWNTREIWLQCRAMTVALDLSLGWSEGDDLRACIASGLEVSNYQLEQFRVCMNDLGDSSSGYVMKVLDLLDDYEAAQLRMGNLNELGSDKILVKADVLEWEANKGGVGSGYGPEREILRVRGLLQQYLGSCVMFNEVSIGLIRS